MQMKRLSVSPIRQQMTGELTMFYGKLIPTQTANAPFPIKYRKYIIMFTMQSMEIVA